MGNLSKLQLPSGDVVDIKDSSAAVKSELNIIDGTGNDAGKTTITLKTGTETSVVKTTKTFAGQNLFGSGDLIQTITVTGTVLCAPLTSTFSAIISAGSGIIGMWCCKASHNEDVFYKYDSGFASMTCSRSSSYHVLDFSSAGIYDVLVIEGSSPVTFSALEASSLGTLTAQTVKSFYSKPSTGIPSSDMASAVQTNLGKADTAVQPSDMPFEKGSETGSVLQKGTNTEITNTNEVALGTYNDSHTKNDGTAEQNAAGSTAFSVGVGTGSNNRQNAIEVTQDGSVFIKNLGQYDGTNPTANSNDLATVVASLFLVMQGLARKPVVVWETSGTGLTALETDMSANPNWQLTDLDFSPYSYVKIYTKAAQSSGTTASASTTAAMVLEISLDSRAAGPYGGHYIGSIVSQKPNDRNRLATLACAISADKTSFAVIRMTNLYGTAASGNSDVGGEVFKIVGFYD